MANKNNNDVNSFLRAIRDYIPFYGFSLKAIELVFLKYLADYKKVSSPDDFEVFMDYKDMFISRKFDWDVIYRVFVRIERQYNMPKYILTDSIETYSHIFDENPSAIFNILNNFEVPKNVDEMKEVIEVILDYSDNKDVSKTGVSTSNKSLVKLVKQILNVKPNEVFMDSFAGLGRSSLNINAGYYLGYESNYDVTTVANMIMVLTGKENFQITVNDYYHVDCREVADKVFTDGPIAVNLSDIQVMMLDGKSRKAEYYNLVKAVESLKPNGIAAVTCSTGVLSRADFRKLREHLTCRNLKAVITLPPLWAGTMALTSLIILEKKRRGNDVMIIDASSSDNYNRVDKRTIELTDEAISKIVLSVRGNEIEGFSVKVPSEMIVCGDQEQSWTPSRYIKSVSKVEYRASSLVKDDLAEAYSDFYRLINNK